MAREEPAGEGDSARDGAHKSAAVRGRIGILILVVGCAFAIYWVSSIVLGARKGPPFFGADTWFYTKLAQADVIERIPSDYHLDRITRFHPTTVVLAIVWMKILAPLSSWIDPLHLLRVMFAAIGAAGVWAAMSAFETVVARGYAILFGIIYALSFGVWYFASVEESKIITASLSALYIAGYLHLRRRWTNRGAGLLTLIMLLGCLNEIVFGFLLIVPLVDAFLQRSTDLRLSKWIAAQALAGVLALVILEGVINNWLLTGRKLPEEASHFSMMLFYMTSSAHSAPSLYLFLTNWLFFNIAAPTTSADYALPAWPHYKGYFEPSLANYLFSPATAALAAVSGIILAAILLPRYRASAFGNASGIIVPLVAYTVLRGAFFFVFNPGEALLFSSAVTLPHMLIIAMPFAASSFPAKPVLLAAFGVLLLVVNGSFILG